MVIDLFYFFNELDLLEIRLSLLDPHVDRFVIVEATKTFSGIDRELVFPKHAARYARWMHKIKYHVVDDFSDEIAWEQARRSPNVGAGEHWWVREFYIKEKAKTALQSLDLSDDDVVYVSDLDEVWDPDAMPELDDKSYYRPMQRNYMYWLNNRSDKDWKGWTGTVATRYRNLKGACLNHVRTHGRTECVEVPNGGWHFTYMGGYEGARRKIEESAHPEYVGVLDSLRTAVDLNMDYRFRPTRQWVDESDLPKWLLDNKERYKHLFK